MSKKTKVVDASSLRTSVGAFWANKKADKTSAFNFYKSYLGYKHDKEDWLAMKLAKEDKDWILQFFKRQMKKADRKPKEGVVPTSPKRKLEKITINKISSGEDITDLPGKITVFVDAGTKNNGKKGLQETRIACLQGDETVVFDDFIGDCTNNQGEIRAILTALQIADSNKWSLNIYSDSQIAIGWTIRGLTKGSFENDTFAKQAKDLLEKTKSVITWSPRDYNLAGIYLEDQYSI